MRRLTFEDIILFVTNDNHAPKDESTQTIVGNLRGDVKY